MFSETMRTVYLANDIDPADPQAWERLTEKLRAHDAAQEGATYVAEPYDGEASVH